MVQRLAGVAAEHDVEVFPDARTVRFRYPRVGLRGYPGEDWFVPAVIRACVTVLSWRLRTAPQRSRGCARGR
jgi:hypothetical protein